MIQTKFDRWLMKKFVHSHQIKVARLPDKIPRGVMVSEIRSKNYHYLLTVKNQRRAERLIDLLNDQGFLYKTNVVDSSHWYNFLINNKKKSFTFRVFWWAVTLAIGLFLLFQIRQFMQTDLYFELLEDAKSLINT